MPDGRSRALWSGAIVVGLLLVAYALLSGPTEEERIVELLEELESALDVKDGENVVIRSARLRSAFGECFDPKVSVRLPELRRSTSTREELVGFAGQAPLRYQNLAFDLSVSSMEVGPQFANVEAEVKVSEEVRGSDSRQLSLRLSKQDGDWRILSVLVKPPDEQVNEADTFEALEED